MEDTTEQTGKTQHQADKTNDQAAAFEGGLLAYGGRAHGLQGSDIAGCPGRQQDADQRDTHPEGNSDRIGQQGEARLPKRPPHEALHHRSQPCFGAISKTEP